MDSAPAVTTAPTRLRRFLDILVRRRVAISGVTFIVLVAEDVLGGHRPHSLLNLHDSKTVIGLALVGLGLGLRTWAAGVLRKNSQLATDGPYGMMRNPLYVGSFMMMFGFCALIDDAENIYFVAGPFAALYVVGVLYEEQTLSLKFAETWGDYARRVPRFIPRRLPGSVLECWDLGQWRRNREYQAVLATLLGLAALQVWHDVG